MRILYQRARFHIPVPCLIPLIVILLVLHAVSLRNAAKKMDDGKVLSKLIGLNSLLSYKKIHRVACAHVLCIKASPSREGQIPQLSSETTLIILIFSGMIVKSDPLNWLPFWRILGSSCLEIFQTQFKLHKNIPQDFNVKFPVLNVSDGNLCFFRKDVILNWITIIF